MDKGLQNAESVLLYLRRCRPNSKDLRQLKALLEHAEKQVLEKREQHARVLEEIIGLSVASSKLSDLAQDQDRAAYVVWMTHLQEQQKLPLLSEKQLNTVMQWLISVLGRCKENSVCVLRVCIAIERLIACHPSSAAEYFSEVVCKVLPHLRSQEPSDVIICALRCLDCSWSSSLDESKGIELGSQVLRLFFANNKLEMNETEVPVFLLNALKVLQRLASCNEKFVIDNASELIGLSKALFLFGVGRSIPTLPQPQKVHLSQQVLYDSTEEFEVNSNVDKNRTNGGKTPKARKPRLNVRNGERSMANKSPNRKSTLLSLDMKTSDSDASESEGGACHVLYERTKMAKIRIASISLISAIIKSLDQRMVYGYWHALLPNGTGDKADNLLHVAQHDPNMRSRCSALQVCAQLLYGSKSFLNQADFEVQRSSAFIPFSISLGLTMHAIYSELCSIMATESSLPVLTQAIKCLAVLIQATPFEKLERDFVRRLVRSIHPFVYHKDAAVQVSALMAMEFLVSSLGAASGLTEVVGGSHSATTELSKQITPFADNEVECVEFEEFVESDDSESESSIRQDEPTNMESVEQKTDLRQSWLLRRVLQNLEGNHKVVATSVRIESLQVLIALSSHFAVIQPHLAQVAKCLLHVMANPLPEVRLYVARCIDTCAFAIGRYALSSSTSSAAKLKILNEFWLPVLPALIEHIRRDADDMSAVRVNLCDALSNIGVVMFESCSRSSQMGLLSFLSGVSSDGSEDKVVRAAAIRALAVYVLFPSLRNDLVFVENTAELTLRLVKETNMLVRAKAFWALGNISDALIGKSPEMKDAPERISNELLFRMISASVAACSDNDKVRCNAVRTLGNLLSLLGDQQFESATRAKDWRQLFEKAVGKLADCVRSSGNAKVKWNTCYAISNTMRNSAVFTYTDLKWQNTLFPALCHVIVQHSNFKVRINAATAITSIGERSHFGSYFEKFWVSIAEAIGQSHNLESFQEYNHRDNLQYQLCLALAHILDLSVPDDWPLLRRRLDPDNEAVIRQTWKRVALRVLPEMAAPLLSCAFRLLQMANKQNLSFEQRNAIDYLAQSFAIE